MDHLINKTLGINVLTTIISILVSIIAAEIGLRALYPQELGIWYYTRDRISVHVPNFKSRQINKFGQRIQFNSWGMRDREHSLKKEDATFRILLLGDSFMEALQVSLEESLPRLLELRLQNAKRFSIEVLNAGVSGWGTDDQLAYLNRYGIKFNPDLILIAMTLHNDVSDNLLEEYHSFVDREIVELPMQKVPILEYMILRLKGVLAAHSHLYQLMRRYLHLESDKKVAALLDNHVRDLIRVKSTSELKRGWAMTHQLLKRIEVIGAKIGAATAIVLLPLSIQMSEKTVKEYLAAHALSRGEVLVDKPQQVMKKWGIKEGVVVIDLLPAFRIYTEIKMKNLYASDGHWNKLGHWVASKVVARELLKRKLVWLRSNQPAIQN